MKIRDIIQLFRTNLILVMSLILLQFSILFVLIIISRESISACLIEGPKTYEYLTIESPQHLLMKIFQILSKVLNIPSSCMYPIFAITMTLISNLLMFVLLFYLGKILHLEKKIGLLASVLGSLIYVFYPRTLIADVGISFLYFKAFLPLYLLLLTKLYLSMLESRLTKPFNKSLLASSYLYISSLTVSISYVFTIDPRIVLHSLIIGFIYTFSLSIALGVTNVKEALRKHFAIYTFHTFMVLLLSLPRLYIELIYRMNLRAGVAFVEQSFLYGRTTYLTVFMGEAFATYTKYLFLNNNLNFLSLLFMAITIFFILVYGNLNVNKQRLHKAKILCLILIGFFLLFQLIFCAPQFQTQNLLLKIVFSGPMIQILQMKTKVASLIRSLLLLFRAPRFIDDYTRVVFTFLCFASITVTSSMRRRDKKYMFSTVIVTLLSIATIFAWLYPLFLTGNGLYNAKDVRTLRYYEIFLSKYGIQGSLNSIMFKGVNPKGYLVYAIMPVRHLWPADGTIANYIYEFLRGLVYIDKDLVSFHYILKLMGIRYIIINCEDNVDTYLLRILNESTLFTFKEKIGYLYVYKVNYSERCGNIVHASIRIPLVVGGLRTYLDYIRYINSVRNNSTSKSSITIPIMYDSMVYNLTSLFQLIDVIIFNSLKDINDLALAMLVRTQDKEDVHIIIPSEYSYSYSPRTCWSPGFPAYPFHGWMPRYEWFNSPYLWELGFDFGYGYLWTLARNCTVEFDIKINHQGQYFILINTLVSPKSGKMMLEIDNPGGRIIASYYVDTHINTQISLLKTKVLGPITLSQGTYRLKLTNINGLNMVNVILIVNSAYYLKIIDVVEKLLRSLPVIIITSSPEVMNKGNKISLKYELNVPKDGYYDIVLFQEKSDYYNNITKKHQINIELWFDDYGILYKELKAIKDTSGGDIINLTLRNIELKRGKYYIYINLSKKDIGDKYINPIKMIILKPSSYSSLIFHFHNDVTPVKIQCNVSKSYFREYKCLILKDNNVSKVLITIPELYGLMGIQVRESKNVSVSSVSILYVFSGFIIQDYTNHSLIKLSIMDQRISVYRITWIIFFIEFISFLLIPTIKLLRRHRI